MAWTVRFEFRAEKDFAKLDRTIQQRIVAFILQRLSTNPKLYGKPLTGRRYAGLWRFRVGDYRLIGEINDTTQTLSIYEIGHRREIYQL